MNKIQKEKEKAICNYNNLLSQYDLYFNNKLNGNEIIDSFEKEWTKWNVDQTIIWFKLILKNVKNNECNNNNNSDRDYEIEYYGCSSDDTSSSNDSEEENDEKKDIEQEIDFIDIKSKLEAIGFRSKKDLPLFKSELNFKQCGFKNKNHCKLLCKQTKLLIKKYPKLKRKKSKKVNEKDKTDDYDDLEGMVKDTGK